MKTEQAKRKARGGKDLFSLQNKGGGKMKSKRYKTTHSTSLDMIEEMNRSKPQTIVNVSIREVHLHSRAQYKRCKNQKFDKRMNT